MLLTWHDLAAKASKRQIGERRGWSRDFQSWPGIVVDKKFAKEAGHETFWDLFDLSFGPSLSTMLRDELKEQLHSVEALEAEVDEVAEATQRAMQELRGHLEELQGGWRGRFEAFLAEQRQQSPRLEQNLSLAQQAVEDVRNPSMQRFLMTALQQMRALADAESRRHSLLTQ